MKFPRLHGRSLAGEELEVPDDLPGSDHVLLLAFQQWQQRDIDAWIAARSVLGVESIYEVPMLGGRWQPFRRVIDGGMAANIRDQHVLTHTVTVYGQISAVEGALSLPTRDQVYAVVVRGDEVRHVAPGRPGDAEVVAVALRD
jgi:hypothetical protein